MIKKTVDDVRGKIDQVPVNQVFNWRRLWVQAGRVPRPDGRAVRAVRGRPSAPSPGPSPGTFCPRVPRRLRHPGRARRAAAEHPVAAAGVPGGGRLPRATRCGSAATCRRRRSASPRTSGWSPTRKAPVGWRPLTWADVPNVCRATRRRTLPLQPVRDARFAVDFGPFLYGAAHPFTAPTLPADVAERAGRPREVAGGPGRAGVRRERGSAGHPGREVRRPSSTRSTRRSEATRREGRRPVHVPDPAQAQDPRRGRAALLGGQDARST